MKIACFIFALGLLLLPAGNAHAFRTTTAETTATLALEIETLLGSAKCLAQPGDKVRVLGTPTIPEIAQGTDIETPYSIRMLSGKCLSHEATVFESALKDMTEAAE